MVFGVKMNGVCPCCTKMIHTGDMWHCEDCWNKHHNGLKDNDFIPEKEFREREENNGYLEIKKWDKEIKQWVVSGEGNL